MAIKLPSISKFSQRPGFRTSVPTPNIQQSLLHLEIILFTVCQYSLSSLFYSKVIHNFLCIILVIRKMAKHLNTLIIPLSYVIHRQKFENNTSSIKNFQICLCKCIQRDPEVQKNKLNKSQWDGTFFPREKKQDTTDFS